MKLLLLSIIASASFQVFAAGSFSPGDDCSLALSSRVTIGETAQQLGLGLENLMNDAEIEFQTSMGKSLTTVRDFHYISLEIKACGEEGPSEVSMRVRNRELIDIDGHRRFIKLKKLFVKENGDLHLLGFVDEMKIEANFFFSKVVFPNDRAIGQIKLDDSLMITANTFVNVTEFKKIEQIK